MKLRGGSELGPFFLVHLALVLPYFLGRKL